MEERKAIELRVVVKEVEANGKTWKKFLLVQDGGRLVDLRFKKGNNTSDIEKCNKCKVIVEHLSDASSHYEYPRFYADGIMSVEKLN